uniref:Ig-like domain-containing protein n=1 Tax=Equus asinus asinus TaxID=83772 RepID=A0A8C4LWF5_EQUAS
NVGYKKTVSHYRWVCLSWSQSVTQPDDHITVSEGAPLELKCNFSYSTSLYFFWYVQQESGEGPVLLMALAKSGETKQQKRLGDQFDKERKDSSLLITAAHPGDAGIYLCAGAQCSWGACCLHPHPAAGSQSHCCHIPPASPHIPLSMSNDNNFSPNGTISNAITETFPHTLENKIPLL